MLVLTRKTEQKIRIGNNIVITVLKVQGEQVSIGIDAPQELQIVREELLTGDLVNTATRQNRKSVIDKHKNPKADLEDVAETLNDDL